MWSFYRVIAVLIIAAVPAGLILSTTSAYNTQAAYTRPGGVCGSFWEIESSGFPLFWRTESILLGITKPCAAQFETDSVTYDWNAFWLDTAFYAAMFFASGFMILLLQSRLKAYQDSVSLEQVEPP